MGNSGGSKDHAPKFVAGNLIEVQDVVQEIRDKRGGIMATMSSNRVPAYRPLTEEENALFRADLVTFNLVEGQTMVWLDSGSIGLFIEHHSSKTADILIGEQVYRLDLTYIKKAAQNDKNRDSGKD